MEPCCATTCCSPASSSPAATTPRRWLEIELLYLDLNVCDRCVGTDAVLQEAIEDVKRVLGPTGIDVTHTKTHVRTAELARERAFVSSPTIRVNGRDLPVAPEENACGPCGDLGGCGINCRVWTWQGEEHPVPPRAMLVDAILREAYLHPDGVRHVPEPLQELPENLARYFEGVKRR